MREIRPSGSAGGAGQLNAPFLPRSRIGLVVVWRTAHKIAGGESRRLKGWGPRMRG